MRFLNYRLLCIRVPTLTLHVREDFTGHIIAMGVFGYGGYWAYRWDIRAAELIAEKRALITERREQKLALAQESDE